MAISNPETNIQIIPAYQQVRNQNQRILFIGQQTATIYPSGSLVTDISNENGEASFGVGSMLFQMVRAAKNINKLTRMDAIPLNDDVGGTAATGTIAFTGTASASGTLYITTGSTKNHRLALGIESGDTANIVGIALQNLINEDLESPVSANNVSGTVTITADNKGLEGNKITLKVEGSVAGIPYTFSGMSGGATNPSLTNVLDIVDAQRYQTIVFPSSYLINDSGDNIYNFLESRWNPSGDKILDGIGITTITDTYANLINNLGWALNSKNFVFIPNRAISESYYTGSALLELDHVISSQFAAIRALRLTPGAPLGSFTLANEGSKDYFGGIHMATFPYHNIPFANLPLIDTDDMWLDSEREGLKAVGYTILGNNVSSTSIICDSGVTRYRTDAAGRDDLSYKYINYVDQASNVREYFHNGLKAAFSQYRLTPGSLVPGYNMANAKSIRGEIMKLYGDLAGIALVPSGEVARKAFLSKLVVTIDQETGDVIIQMLDPVITQLRKIDATMQLSFSINR